MAERERDEGAARQRPRLDVAALASALRERRQLHRLSIRQAAAEAGVSFSTWSRVEDGAQPDLSSFLALTAWLREPPDRFFLSTTSAETNALEDAIGHLKRDPALTRAAADKIASVLREMHQALAREAPAPAVLACHLRGQTVLRPGVPERLADLLQDLKSALETAHDGPTS